MAEKPWKRLPTKPNGDNSPDPIFCAVGRTLTEWERLQTALIEVFSVLVESRAYALKRAFGIQDSAGMKVQMINYAARYALRTHPDLLEKLSEFTGEVNQFTGRRNDIAHGIVDHHDTPTHDTEKIAVGYYLAPAYSATKKYNIDSWPVLPAYFWTADQILYYEGEFSRLRAEAEQLRRDLIHRSPLELQITSGTPRDA